MTHAVHNHQNPMNYECWQESDIGVMMYQCQNETVVQKIVEEVLIAKYVGVVGVDMVGVVDMENVVVVDVDMEGNEKIDDGSQSDNADDNNDHEEGEEWINGMNQLFRKDGNSVEAIHTAFAPI